MITIEVPIFAAWVELHTDRAAFAKAHEARSERELDMEACDGMSSDFSGSVYMVGVFNGDKSVLVHELAHTAFKILRDCNIKADHKNQEAFCYLQEWLFKELHDHI